MPTPFLFARFCACAALGLALAACASSAAKPRLETPAPLAYARISNEDVLHVIVQAVKWTPPWQVAQSKPGLVRVKLEQGGQESALDIAWGRGEIVFTHDPAPVQGAPVLAWDAVRAQATAQLRGNLVRCLGPAYAGEKKK